MDPLLRLLAIPIAPCTKNAGCFRRQKILDSCEEKFSGELEITSLLRKIRDSHDMLKFMTNSH